MKASAWKRSPSQNPVTVTSQSARTNRPFTGSTQARSTFWRNLLTRSNRLRHPANERFGLEARWTTSKCLDQLFIASDYTLPCRTGTHKKKAGGIYLPSENSQARTTVPLTPRSWLPYPPGHARYRY